jgi:hypothetical protein
MKVKDLADNMLVIPSAGSTWQYGPDDSDEGVLEKNGISGHIIMHLDQFPIPGYKCLQPGPAMYLYSRHDGWMYGGVFTHHYLLVNGMVCIIDGYQFKDIEPAK